MTVKRPDMDDFRDENGKLNWGAYKQAEVDGGWCCANCKGYISTWGKRKPGPNLCVDCKSLKEDDGEVFSDSFIRCPKCDYQENVWESDDYEVLNDGEHQVQCYKCNYEYEIMTEISHTFTSPERIK